MIDDTLMVGGVSATATDNNSQLFPGGRGSSNFGATANHELRDIVLALVHQHHGIKSQRSPSAPFAPWPAIAVAEAVVSSSLCCRSEKYTRTTTQSANKQTQYAVSTPSPMP